MKIELSGAVENRILRSERYETDFDRAEVMSGSHEVVVYGRRM